MFYWMLWQVLSEIGQNIPDPLSAKKMTESGFSTMLSKSLKSPLCFKNIAATMAQQLLVQLDARAASIPEVPT